MEKKAWSGRFAGTTHSLVEAFTASIAVDVRLWRQDITCSVAHAQMLGEVGLISMDEAEQLVAAMHDIGAAFERGEIELRPDLEDIHMHIEAALIHRLGDIGRKLHTARSRNDQVATTLRLWTREAIDQVNGQIGHLQAAFVTAASREQATLMPGYTHLQRAQPVLAAHSFLAHVERLERDRLRLCDARARVNLLPLGSAALAGTSLPIDRSSVQTKLGFAGLCTNSLDAVSDRDFVVETVFALSLIASHLSGWAEEWILWNTHEFGFIQLPDALCTGSSIMPQKKNPDVLELIRGRTGRVTGDLMSLLMLLKSLPLAYNRDLQEDKPALFDAVDSVLSCLELATLIVDGARLRQDRISAQLEAGFLDATTLMEALISQQVPMRTAHGIVGALVKAAEEGGLHLADLPNAVLQATHPALLTIRDQSLGVKKALEAFRSKGSTAPKLVAAELSRWSDLLTQRGFATTIA